MSQTLSCYIHSGVECSQCLPLHSIVCLRHSGSVLLDLVDLAGSEEHGVPITPSPGENLDKFLRRKHRDTKDSEQEASAINKGLSWLRQVFESLKRGKEPMYRDTKLTLALRDTLGLFLFPFALPLVPNISPRAAPSLAARGCKCRLILNVAFEGDEPRNLTDSLDFGDSAANTSLGSRESEGSS